MGIFRSAPLMKRLNGLGRVLTYSYVTNYRLHGREWQVREKERKVRCVRS